MATCSSTISLACFGVTCMFLGICFKGGVAATERRLSENQQETHSEDPEVLNGTHLGGNTTRSDDLEVLNGTHLGGNTGVVLANLSAPYWQYQCDEGAGGNGSFDPECLPKVLQETGDVDLFMFAQYCGLDAAAFKHLNFVEQRDVHSKMLLLIRDNLLVALFHYLFANLAVKLFFPHMGEKNKGGSGGSQDDALPGSDDGKNTDPTKAEADSSGLLAPGPVEMVDSTPKMDDSTASLGCQRVKATCQDLAVSFFGALQIIFGIFTCITVLVHLGVEFVEFSSGVVSLESTDHSWSCKANLLSQFFHYGDAVELLVLGSFSVGDMVAILINSLISIVLQCAAACFACSAFWTCCCRCCGQLIHACCCEICICCSEMCNELKCCCDWFWTCKCCRCCCISCEATCSGCCFFFTHCNCLCIGNIIFSGTQVKTLVVAIILIGFLPLGVYFVVAMLLVFLGMSIIFVVLSALLILVFWILANFIALVSQPLKCLSLATYAQPFRGYYEFAQDYITLIQKNFDDFDICEWKQDEEMGISKLTGEPNMCMQYIAMGQQAVKNRTFLTVACPICLLMTMPLLSGLPMLWLACQAAVYANTSWMLCSKYSDFCVKDLSVVQNFNGCKCRSCETAEMLGLSESQATVCPPMTFCPSVGLNTEWPYSGQACYGMRQGQSAMPRLDGFCNCSSQDFNTTTEIQNQGLDFLFNTSYLALNHIGTMETYIDQYQDPNLGFGAFKLNKLGQMWGQGFWNINHLLYAGFVEVLWGTIDLAVVKYKALAKFLFEQFYTLQNALVVLKGWMMLQLDFGTLRTGVLLGRSIASLCEGATAMILFNK